MNKAKPFDLIKRLVKARPEARIIGSSTYGNLDEYSELGVKDFLPNPWSDDDLLRIVCAPSESSSRTAIMH
jgi:hypothetical protein